MHMILFYVWCINWICNVWWRRRRFCHFSFLKVKYRWFNLIINLLFFSISFFDSLIFIFSLNVDLSFGSFFLNICTNDDGLLLIVFSSLFLLCSLLPRNLYCLILFSGMPLYSVQLGFFGLSSGGLKTSSFEASHDNDLGTLFAQDALSVPKGSSYTIFPWLPHFPSLKKDFSPANFFWLYLLSWYQTGDFLS